MPDNPPPPPTPKPGEAAPPPPPPPAPTHDAEGKELPHPLLPELMKSLLDDVPTETMPGQKPPEKKEPEKKEPEKKEPEAKEPEKPIRVRKAPAEKRPELPLEPAPAAPPAAAPAAAKPAEPPDDSDLEPEEKEMISDAQEAERLFPEKYKGLGEKARKYVRDHIKFINDHGGDENFDPDNPEYSAEYARFLEANQPRLTRAQVREINETRITNQVQEKTKTEFDHLKDERFADREEPLVVRAAQQSYTQLAPLCCPKEISDDIKARGYPEAYKDYKLELDTIDATLRAVADDVAEFERVTRINSETGRPLAKVANYPNEPKFQQHQRLALMVRQICDEFEKTGGSELKRDGRWFVTKDEYAKIKKNRPDLLGGFWTFSNKEILDRAHKKVPAVVSAAIATKIKEQEALGFVRRPREKKAETPPPPAAKGAPAAPHPTPAPSGGGGGEAKSEGAKLAALISNG